MFKNVNYDEIKKLHNALKVCKIPHYFERHTLEFCGYHYHIFYPSKEDCKCSIILAPFSYGAQHGLLEIMGLLTDEEAKHDSVVGYLTAQEVFKRIVNDYE